MNEIKDIFEWDSNKSHVAVEAFVQNMIPTFILKDEKNWRFAGEYNERVMPSCIKVEKFLENVFADNVKITQHIQELNHETNELKTNITIIVTFLFNEYLEWDVLINEYNKVHDFYHKRKMVFISDSIGNLRPKYDKINSVKDKFDLYKKKLEVKMLEDNFKEEFYE